MKFKGFWKDYLEVCKVSFAWIRKYWFPYTLICVGFGIFYFSLACLNSFGLDDFKSLFTKRTDEEVDEFLK